MIYFDRQTQQDVVRRLADCLEPGGYFFTGHAESLAGISHSLEYVQPALYRKPLRRGGGMTTVVVGMADCHVSAAVRRVRCDLCAWAPASAWRFTIRTFA